MIHRLAFDTTDADTIADSANVGAYIRSSDGTLVTHTTDGSREAIDVYTELGQTEDAAHSSGDTGVMGLAVRNDVEGSLVSADGDYAPLQVDSSGRLRTISDLDYTDGANKNEDDAHSSGDEGKYVLAVRADARPTDANTSADGDYASFFVNNSGEQYVKDADTLAQLVTIDGVLDNILADTNAMVVDLAAIEVEQLAQGVTLDTIAGDTTSIDSTLTALSKAEDSAHVSGDQGTMGLAVRNDTLGSLVDADGDYAPFQVNSDGALYVDIGSGGGDTALANTAVANAANVLDAANVAEDAVAAPLANRKYLFINNYGNREIYVGSTGVTSSNGFPMPPGAVLEMRAGASIDIEWVGPNTNQEIRTLEFS